LSLHAFSETANFSLRPEQLRWLLQNERDWQPFAITAATMDERQNRLKTAKLINEFNASLNSAKAFALQHSDQSSTEYIKYKDQEFGGLDVLRKKQLSGITQWALAEDIKLLDQYVATGDFIFLKASLDNVSSLLDAQQPTTIKERTVTITVSTVPEPGYQVCYTMSEWKDLEQPPTRSFPRKSTSSEDMPADRSFTFWAMSYEDSSQVGPRTTHVTNKSESIDVGCPPIRK
jgi:hypothetical protein